MTSPTTVPEDFGHLLQAAFAVLATNGPDGLPQVTAVSFLHDPDDGLLKLSLNDTRQKTKNMHRDPRATLFILDPDNPLRSLEVRGRVELAPDPDFAFCAKAGAKYGQDFHRHDGAGETRSIVTIHPVRINPMLLG